MSAMDSTNTREKVGTIDMITSQNEGSDDDNSSGHVDKRSDKNDSLNVSDFYNLKSYERIERMYMILKSENPNIDFDPSEIVQNFKSYEDMYFALIDEENLFNAFYHLCAKKYFLNLDFLYEESVSDGSESDSDTTSDTGQTFMITNLSLIFDVPFDSRPYILDFNIEYLKNNKVESIKEPGKIKEEIVKKGDEYKNSKNLSEKTLLVIYYLNNPKDNEILLYQRTPKKTSNNGEESLSLNSKTLPDEFFTIKQRDKLSFNFQSEISLQVVYRFIDVDLKEFCEYITIPEVEQFMNKYNIEKKDALKIYISMIYICFFENPSFGINDIENYIEPDKIINFYNGFCYFFGDREKKDYVPIDFCNKYLPLNPLPFNITLLDNRPIETYATSNSDPTAEFKFFCEKYKNIWTFEGDFKEIEESEKAQVFTMLCARHVEKLSKNAQDNFISWCKELNEKEIMTRVEKEIFDDVCNFYYRNTTDTRSFPNTFAKKVQNSLFCTTYKKMQNFSSFKRPWSFKQALEIEVKNNNWLKSKRLPNLKNLKNLHQLFFAMEDNNVKLIKNSQPYWDTNCSYMKDNPGDFYYEIYLKTTGHSIIAYNLTYSKCILDKKNNRRNIQYAGLIPIDSFKTPNSYINKIAVKSIKDLWFLEYIDQKIKGYDISPKSQEKLDELVEKYDLYKYSENIVYNYILEDVLNEQGQVKDNAQELITERENEIKHTFCDIIFKQNNQTKHQNIITDLNLNYDTYITEELKRINEKLKPFA